MHYVGKKKKWQVLNEMNCDFIEGVEKCCSCRCGHERRTMKVGASFYRGGWWVGGQRDKRGFCSSGGVILTHSLPSWWDAGVVRS